MFVFKPKLNYANHPGEKWVHNGPRIKLEYMLGGSYSENSKKKKEANEYIKDKIFSMRMVPLTSFSFIFLHSV